MKFLIFVFLLISVAWADEVKLINEGTRVEHDGTFKFFYELGDGTHVAEHGVLKHVDSEHEGEAVEGKFAFVSDDGQTYSVTYTADENGFRPVGAHLPTPPPVPESVLKTLKYLEEHPYHPPENQKY